MPAVTPTTYLWPISPTERLRVDDGPGDRVFARLERLPEGEQTWVSTEHFFGLAGGVLTGTRAGAAACWRYLELRTRILGGQVSEAEGAELLRAVAMDPEAQ